MTNHPTHGTVQHKDDSRPTDYLYRISIKCLILNDKNEVLVVKERDRNWWDLPGGGMDHGETIKTAIAREMKEEVNLQGDFSYQVIAVEDPVLLKNHNFWQVRIIFVVSPDKMNFTNGQDSDEIAFMNPLGFELSELKNERLIYEYYSKLG